MQAAFKGPEISIHALLAESDLVQIIMSGYARISIHALLAESDYQILDDMSGATRHFYPRSPCGERHRTATSRRPIFFISIHALLAESDLLDTVQVIVIVIFLSTLSLRRATQNTNFSINLAFISIHALLAESDFLPISRGFIGG